MMPDNQSYQRTNSEHLWKVALVRLWGRTGVFASGPYQSDIIGGERFGPRKGEVRRASAPGYALWIQLLPALVCGSVEAADQELFCKALKPLATDGGDLYVKGPGGVSRRFEDITLDEMKGKRTSFFYLIKRHPRDFPTHLPLPGAANIKIELSEPDATGEVYFFNNHLSPATTCPPRSFDTYQAFHSKPVIDNCIRYRFHNLPAAGEMATAEPRRRRIAFLFPSGSEITFKNFFERFFAPEIEPIKRMSQIHNYTTSGDSVATCIRFEVTTSRDVRGIRIGVDDLLENLRGLRPPPGRWIKK